MAYNNQEINGKTGIGNYNEEAQKVMASKMSKDYESFEFASGGALADYSLKVNKSAFAKFQYAHAVVIRADADISFKFNSASNHAITLTAAEGSFTMDIVEITDIFFSCAGAANIKVILA